MKKLISILLLLYLGLLLISCNKEETIISTKIPTSNVVSEKPNDGSTPLDYSVLENIAIAQNVILNNPYYKTITTGTALTEMIIKNEQSVYAEKIVSNKNILYHSITTSKYKTQAIQRYYNENNFFIREGEVTSKTSATWSNNFDKHDYDFVYENLGYIPNGITGYIINDNSIIDSIVLEKENFFYTVKLTLNPNIACEKTKLEIKFNADALELPKYKSVELTISMNENWQVEQIIMHDIYELKVKLGISITAPIDSTITENFYYDEVIIPEEYLNIF